MDSQYKNICRLGTVWALLAGICYVIMVICAFILPQSIATYVATETYFNDFIKYQELFVFLKIIMIVANLAMIGVVYTFYAICRPKNKAIMAWITLIAIIGYSIGLFQSIIDITMIPYYTQKYMAGSEIVKDIIITLGVSNASIYILSLGLPGIWFIVVSALAINNKYIPKLLVGLGFMWGIGNIVTAIAHTLVILPLIYLVAFGALISAPIWSIWEAIFLHKLSKIGIPYLKTKK